MKENLLLEQLNHYYSLWRESIKMYEDWSRQHGLSYNSVMVLTSIFENPENCTQKLISQKWLMPKQTVNTILKNFEQQKLIKLSPLPSDKRNKLIKPTPAGEQYAAGILAEQRSLELYVLNHMGLEQVKRMNNDFARFVELFQEGAEK